MVAELQKSNIQVATGALELDGETLTGIVVDGTYVFSPSHSIGAVTAHEVEPASEESRFAATAAAFLDEAEAGWYVTVSGFSALDLSDVSRGGVVWVRPNDNVVGWSEDAGGPDAAYLPTWPDGLFFDSIGSYDDLIGRTVAGVAFDVTGDVPADDLAAVLTPTWGDWSDPMLPNPLDPGRTDTEWCDAEPVGIGAALRWRKRTDGMVQISGYAIYATTAPAPLPPTPGSDGFCDVIAALPADLEPDAGSAILPAFSASSGTPAAVAQCGVTGGFGTFKLRVLITDAGHDTFAVDGMYQAIP